MSQTPEREPAVVAPSGATASDAASASASAEESLYRSRSSWPVTRLAGTALTILLAICVAGPATVDSFHASQWPALLVPALLATVSARLVFEAIDASASGRGVRHHLAPAIAGALVAALFMAGASLILGLHWSAVVGGLTVALCGGTLLGAAACRDFEIRIRLALRRVYFAGSAEARGDLGRELARSDEATLVGTSPIHTHLGSAELRQAVADAEATVLVLDRDAMKVPAIVEAASELNLGGVHVRDLVTYYESEFKKVPLAELTPAWFLFDIAAIHRRPTSRSLGRAVELVLAAGLLLLASPLLALAWAAVRVTSRGPGLYRQRRVGLDGAHFTLLKLRTMTVADETAAWAPSQSHRVTAVGRFLRRFRIDEMPQLFNVIRGDLALIGPRPEQVPIVEALEREIPFYAARHCVRPGLTGWAQVNLGYAGSVEGTIAKLQRDLYYIKHGTLRLDALILWLTVKTMLTGRG
jgi:lipopolysaccharide/colanic/teichoic acid biosynthesis glycosyltransferase